MHRGRQHVRRAQYRSDSRGIHLSSARITAGMGASPLMKASTARHHGSVAAPTAAVAARSTAAGIQDQARRAMLQQCRRSAPVRPAERER